MLNITPAYLRFFIYNNIWVTAMDTLAAGSLLTAYAVSLGAGPLVLGLIGGVAYWGSAFNIVGAYLVSRGFSARKLTVGLSFASRPFYVLSALLALFPLWTNRSWWLFGFSWLSYALGGISAGAYYPWLKQTLPQEQTSGFVHLKYRSSVWAYLFTFTGVLVLFHYLSAQPAFCSMFMLAFVCGCLGSASLLFIPTQTPHYTPTNTTQNQTLHNTYTMPKTLTACMLGLFAFAYFFAFLPVFALKFLKFSFWSFTFLLILSKISFLLSLNGWNKIRTRYNAPYSLRLAFWALALVALAAGACGQLPVRYYGGAGIVLFLAAGAAGAGIKTGIDTFILQQAPQSNCAGYFTAFSFVRLLAAAGAFGAGLGLNSLEQTALNPASVWGWFFAIGFCLCVVTAVFITLKWKEKHA